MYNFKSVAVFTFPVHLLRTNTKYKNVIKFTKREEHGEKHILNKHYCEYVYLSHICNKNFERNITGNLCIY